MSSIRLGVQDDDIDFEGLARLEAQFNLSRNQVAYSEPRYGARCAAPPFAHTNEKENTFVANQCGPDVRSAWKPENQPMWRGGAATIWEKPAQTDVQARAPLLGSYYSNRFIEEDDPYRGWSSPLELKQDASGTCPAPPQNLLLKRDAPAASMNQRNDVPENWFESSDDDEDENMATRMGVEEPHLKPRQVCPKALQPLPNPDPKEECHPNATSNNNINGILGVNTESMPLYEDWYYEKRPTLRGTPAEDLEVCSTTTGGIQVCRNAAQHWVYPAHIPERKYQLHAISRALFSNTLVCYPTGLGKTLIAAVVMHNFFRWFPKSKVIFIAPTKPLVAQQMKACQKFMGLCESSISEMTGKASGESRKAAWNDIQVRVYFCTPQTFWNDVKRGICPYDQISCIVVDECHRATGQADIVKAIKDMRNVKKCKFRVLGLSATPGSSHEQVQEVIDSLGISTLVFKDEMDRDVAPYVHNKKSEMVVVNPECSGHASRGMLMATLQRIVGDLSSRGHYYGVADAERITRFGMQQAKRNCKDTTWTASGQFVQAQVLADVRDQLDSYGPKIALSFLQSKMVKERHIKSLHSSDPQFAHFIGSLQKAQESNPKLEKLKQILVEFFSSSTGYRRFAEQARSTDPHAIRRAIIFASLRDGVASITSALESLTPLVRAKMFIGQGGGKGQAGMKQNEQKQVLAEFTSGVCNLLVATCIGEEGLDIPNVDLIVCFDAISSPTRALQRQGRTGRHGDGRVIYLLTAGQEEDRFNKSAVAMKKLHTQLREAERFFALNENVVRMLPREFGIPKMAYLVQDADPAERNDRMTGKIVGGVAGATEIQVTKLHEAPFTTPKRATTRHLTPAKTHVQEQDHEAVEEMSLVERLKHMKAKVGGEKRRRRIISSQSTPSNNLPPAGCSPRLGSASSISIENLSVKKATPQQLSRLCRAGNLKSVVSKIKKKKNLGAVEQVALKDNFQRKTELQANANNQNGKPSMFLDVEASLSGEASGDERDDLLENTSLQDFFDDATQDDSPFAQGIAGHAYGGCRDSPGVMAILARVRSRRQEGPMIVDTQSQSFSRATPDEYDRDDSFLADSDEDL